MKSTIEKNINASVIIIYGIIALICVSSVYYMYQMREQFAKQKQSLHHINQQFSLTNAIIFEIQEAQNAAHLLKFQNRKKSAENLNYFNETIGNIEKSIDSLSNFSSDSAHIMLLWEAHSLLLEKQQITAQLALLFNENEISNFAEQLENVSPMISKSDSVVVSRTVVPQKVAKETEVVKKGLFSKQTKIQHDTIIMYKTKHDTLVYSTTDTTGKEVMRSISQQMSHNVGKHLKNIEEQVLNLSVSEQEISKQISVLLTELHKNTLNSLLSETHKSEKLQKRYYSNSIIIIAIALLLVLVFVLLIRNFLNQGLAARVALAQAKKRSEEIMQSRHALLLSVSHDIKAPLSSIMAYLDLLQSELANNEQQQQLFSMQNSAKHILSLLSNLLDFSRLEQGKIEVNASNFDIAQTCKELCNMFTPIAQQKQLAYSIEIRCAEPTFIFADQLKIKQIIVNILSNAFKYTPSGSISVCMENNSSHIIFSVNDSGVGIPNNKKDLLGKQFSRISENNALADGAGLGLFVVNGLLRLLNGSINIQSEEGKGTCVTVKIPYSLAREIPQTQNITNNLAQCAPLNILVIDDDSNLLNVIAKMLEKLGHSATCCLSFKEFNAALHAAEYSCIITDMNMGALQAEHIAEYCKSEAPNLPIIITTAHSEYSHEQAIADGFAALLPKPFSLQSLAQSLETTVAQNQNSFEIHSNFTSLREMFNGDQNAIDAIVHEFTESTIHNMAELQNAANNNNFEQAKAICHRMLPMFLQLDLQNDCEFLIKMNALKNSPASDYPHWRNDLSEFITCIKSKLASWES